MSLFMKVIKRDGSYANVRFDEITDRIQVLCNQHPRLISIDPSQIAQDVIVRIRDKIKTSELDQLTAEICASKSSTHPEYGMLASRLVIDDHQKNCHRNFTDTCRDLYYNKDQLNEHSPLISDSLYKTSIHYAHDIDKLIEHKRDFLIDYFGFKTLEKGYLLKINKRPVETPQHLWMRVSIGIHAPLVIEENSDYFCEENKERILDKIKETYDHLSLQIFTHATPTLFNAGTPYPQMSSCFDENTMVDTLNGPKRIVDVQLGDKVITHKGNVKSVSQLHKNERNGRQMYRIKINNTKIIQVTGNHEFWCLDREIMYPLWVPIDKLDTDRHYVAISNRFSKTKIVDVEHNNQQYTKVDFLQKIAYDKPYVYTLGIEDDHSYSVEGVVVKNCYLIGTEDSVPGIFKTVADCAKISKWAGGIGIHISNIRAKGSLIRKTNGRSDGIVPMLRTFNATARYINQGSRRNGSFAMYLEPWHADVLDFLECKKNHGAMDERALDLFYALWVPDLFMKSVEENKPWYLMCPSKCPGLTDVYGEAFEKLYTQYVEEKRYEKEIRAQFLWDRIIDSLIETGTPYITFKDTINRKSNQQNVGIIKSSNLCVSGDTFILTSEGCFTIDHFVGHVVNVWNGEQWSRTKIVQTGKGQECLNISFSNGCCLKCTPYHKFYIQEGKQQRKLDANELEIGMQCSPFYLPVIDGKSQFEYAYIRGLFCSIGKTFRNYSNKIDVFGKLILPSEKLNVITKISELVTTRINVSEDTFDITLPYDIPLEKTVPLNHSISSKILWLEGMADGNSEYTAHTLTILHETEPIMVLTLYLLQTLGIHSECVHDKEYSVYRLLIKDDNLNKLIVQGFHSEIHALKRKDTHKKQPLIYVTSIEKCTKKYDTYCFKERLKGMGMFNGILTGQCSEIVEYSDDKEYAVCNLNSICLPKCIEDNKFNFSKLQKVVKIVTYNLNEIIDKNFYPVPETERSNMRHRPIGIGVQGLADVFNILRLPFDSEEARHLNRQIFEVIYYAAMEESCRLAEIHGPYKTFEGSPLSKGKFQFDLWNEYGETQCTDPELGLDWDTLRKRIMEKGVYNSLVTAIMPTASTSQIMGNTECCEPRTSNIYTRRTLAGQFLVVNKYLQNDLIKLGIWSEQMKQNIIHNQGSIQHIEEIPKEIKDLYKTIWEIKQKVIVDMAADRGRFIDQSQSMNLFFEEPQPRKLTGALFYGWKKGLKTGSYYIRSKPVRVNTHNTNHQEKECINCSA